MDFFGFNKVFRELEKASWRPTMFEDLQVCYCEEGLYALRCKHGTSNEHICLIREESEDAAIARAVFDRHKRGESEITVRTDNSAVIEELQRRLKVAEDALRAVKRITNHTDLPVTASNAAWAESTRAMPRFARKEQTMSEQDEIFERATETPIALAPSKGGKGAYVRKAFNGLVSAYGKNRRGRSNRKAKGEVAE